MAYFKWMCLPRWLRTFLIALALTLVTVVVFAAIIFGVFWVLQNVNPIFIIVIPIVLVILWVWYSIIENDIEPSIKRKEKDDATHE